MEFLVESMNEQLSFGYAWKKGFLSIDLNGGKWPKNIAYY